MMTCGSSNPSNDRMHTGGSASANATSQRFARSNAFSLVELLVILAVLIVIVAISFSRSSAREQRSRKAKCRQNLHTLHAALSVYALEHQDFYPAISNAMTPSEPLSLLIPKYSSTLTPFHCPGPGTRSLRENVPLTQQPIRYAYYQGRQSAGASLAPDSQASGSLPLMSDAQIHSKAKSAGELAFSSTGDGPGNNHHRFGGNILRINGSVIESPPTLSEALPLGNQVILLNPDPKPDLP